MLIKSIVKLFGKKFSKDVQFSLLLFLRSKLKNILQKIFGKFENGVNVDDCAQLPHLRGPTQMYTPLAIGTVPSDWAFTFTVDFTGRFQKNDTTV